MGFYPSFGAAHGFVTRLGWSCAVGSVVHGLGFRFQGLG